MARTRGGRPARTVDTVGDDSASSSHEEALLEFEGAYFTTDEAIAFYQNSSNKAICGGKWCNPSEFVHGFELIVANFKALGWSNLLVISADFYENLVREFFSNMSETEGVLHTVVKGKRINFDAKWINQLLGCPNEGIEEFVPSKWSPIIVKTDLNEFFPGVVIGRGVNKLKMTYFTPCHRVLYHIVTSILALTQGHKTDISHVSLHLFYAIMRKIKINYGAFFIKYLMYCKKKSQHGLCFGRIITLILAAKKITLDDAQPSTPTCFDIIDAECFRRMHMIHSGNKWMYRKSKYCYCSVAAYAYIGDYIYDDIGRGRISSGRRGGENEAGPSSGASSIRADEGFTSSMLSRFDKMEKMMYKMDKKLDHIMTKEQNASFTALMEAEEEAEEEEDEEEQEEEEEEEEEGEEEEEDAEDEEDEDNEDEEDEEDDHALEVRKKKKSDKL